MSPERSKTVNGKKVCEFWWAGKLVVYVDNRLYCGSFDDAVAGILSEGLAHAKEGK